MVYVEGRGRGAGRRWGWIVGGMGEGVVGVCIPLERWRCSGHMLDVYKDMMWGYLLYLGLDRVSECVPSDRFTDRSE